ncbi:rRNA N6-adenosine-methyltransferase ZCCHC4 [Contarinia nasturtii]|uniref:rRNA N6-adenosine-methyltransferase ZCCHC4 n=1 Tax=Contarinia nasturtii TaxID=265458 RepID=UPI0012D4B56E|nr:rRNA N6-adenosine-methyltransferase ZCCHC4 [Contarinia nasturtii]
MGESIRVVIESDDGHPVCKHGPALLFERRIENEFQRFYACSAYRDQNECPLHVRVDQNEAKLQDRHLLTENKENSLNLAHDQSILMQKVLKESTFERSYCHTCHTFLIASEKISNAHKHHTIQKSITNEQIQRPTTFLRSLSNDKREAQYFFSDESLKCFGHIFKRLQINKIVCIGAPRLHEFLKYHKSKLHIESILLDLDTRFYSFHNRDGLCDFFHYNMFNNYFFGGDEVQMKFHQFLQNANNEKCCIFTDPPFGCRTEPLVSTLQTISQTYRRLNRSHDILPIFWVFPYFMEMYITSLMPEMDMLDYKIDYTNHETYHSGQDGRKQGSPVRIFTNVPSHLIDLSIVNGYRLCKKCKRWVSTENQHCDQCKKCPSKNGDTYVHCKLCATCVKPSYRHCNNCWRCTQIENHQCNKYQLQLKCMICLQKGHNETNCHKWFAVCGKNTKEITKLKAKSIKIGRRICLLCFKPGHNENTCAKRKHLLDEISFLNQCYNKLSNIHYTVTM